MQKEFFEQVKNLYYIALKNKMNLHYFNIFLISLNF